MTNETAAGLAAGESVLGAWVESASPRLAEALAATRLDWLGIDMEHTPVGPGEVESLVRAIHPDATPIVRLPSVEYAVARGCKLALDAGAGGVIVPRVESAADAEAVVEAATFPPDGDRGVAGSVRANGFGEGFDEHVATADDERLVVVQLETAAGIEHADDIVSVPGVDVAFVGENDLSASLGTPGEKTREPVQDGVEAVRRAASEAGVHAGVAARDGETRAEREAQGFRFFLLGGDCSLAREGLAARLDD
ncbi:HpcH/HpaI aldolase family protein [Haloarchaeobius amylolyticus]|uniref:HpcH/HpaI aldolase family protein n=1 Tax=Haloarchaeobius amylolyticus TaxID=1198296 RepID=UPI002270CAC4|nr:aldolase/citrate lyase family protein [Haloarchaeobius amylolyticus]